MLLSFGIDLKHFSAMMPLLACLCVCVFVCVCVYNTREECMFKL